MTLHNNNQTQSIRFTFTILVITMQPKFALLLLDFFSLTFFSLFLKLNHFLWVLDNFNKLLLFQFVVWMEVMLSKNHKVAWFEIFKELQTSEDVSSNRKLVHAGPMYKAGGKIKVLPAINSNPPPWCVFYHAESTEAAPLTFVLKCDIGLLSSC